MTTAEKRREYSKLRKQANERGRRLERAGLGIRADFPTLSNISDTRDLNKALRVVRGYVTNPATTVRGARAALVTANLEFTARDAKRIEQRARHAEAQRRYRERIKALSPAERGLLQMAKRWGIKNVTPSTVKKFGAYLEYRESVRGLSFQYTERAEVARDYDKLQEMRIDPDVIAQDFREYMDNAMDELERHRGEMSTREYKQYSADFVDELWQQYIEDVEDERRTRKRRR